MRNWLRELLPQRRPRGQPLGRTALVSSLVTAGVTIALWLGRETLFELVGDLANSVLLRGPIWLRVLVATVLLAGAGAAVTALIRARRLPRPDEPPEAPARPLTLPPGLPAVIGRDDDLARVSSLLESEHAVAVVGRRTIGTSTLALGAAQGVAHRFPDGQVYVDVRGATSGLPLTGPLALRRVLRQLGLPEPTSDHAHDLEQAAERLRRWLDARRLLFVLDNVDHPEQVRWLLPGGAACRFLLAGSVDLEELPGAYAYIVRELAEDDAVALLATAVDPAVVARDRAAAVDLVNRCGRQPLAIRLIGQLLQDRQWPLRRVGEAVEQGLQAPAYAHGLEQLVLLRPLLDACHVTYQDLSPAHRRIFRLLALVPTTEIGVHAAAAVAGISPDRAARLLAELARRGLVESVRPGRFRIRDTLSTSARIYLSQEEPARQVDRARTRLARYCALVTEEYAEPLVPLVRRSGQEHDGERVLAKARSWFSYEHELLFQLVTSREVAGNRATGAAGAPTAARQRWLWRLAVGLCTWYAVEGRLNDWAEVCTAVLRMPLARTNPAVALWAHNELGVIYRQRGEPRRGWQELQDALRLSHASRRRGLAQVHTNLGLTLLDQGQLDSALRHLESGLELRARADRHGQAVSALGLGIAYLRVDQLDASRGHLSLAANVFDTLNHRRGLAAALNALGVVLWEQDDPLGAAEHWDLARTMYAELRDDGGLASVLLNIAAGMVTAEPHRAAEVDQLTEAERMAQARELLEECLRLRSAHQQTRVDGLAHLHLGDVIARCGGPDEARAHWATAARILAPLGGPEAAEAANRAPAALVE